MAFQAHTLVGSFDSSSRGNVRVCTASVWDGTRDQIFQECFLIEVVFRLHSRWLPWARGLGPKPIFARQWLGSVMSWANFWFGADGCLPFLRLSLGLTSLSFWRMASRSEWKRLDIIFQTAWMMTTTTYSGVDVGWCGLMWVDVGWCGLMWVDVGWCGLMWVDVGWCVPTQDKVVPISAARQQRESLASYGYRGESHQHICKDWSELVRSHYCNSICTETPRFRKVSFSGFQDLGHEFDLAVWDNVIEFAEIALDGLKIDAKVRQITADLISLNLLGTTS